MAPKRRHQTRTNHGTFTPDTASIVKVFNAALVNPLHPTGCIHLLNESLMVFGEDQYIGNVLSDLRQNHHDFYTTCMRFLVTPPPGEHKDSKESESTKELISIMTTCTCDLSNPTIKYLHERSHKRQGKPNLQTIFSNIAGAVQMALQPAKAEGKVHKVESNLKKASEKGLEAPLWPTCPQELFPIGAEETMNALAQWLEIHAAPGLLGFLGSYLEICKRAAIPYFIASPTLPGKFVGIAEIIYMVWAFQEQSDRASCATSLTLLKGAALVALLLTSHCTKQELVEFEKRAEVQHRSVLGLCKTILEWLPKLDASIWPRDSYQSYDAGKGVSEDIAYVRECFTGLGQCIHYFMDLPFDVEEYHPTIVWRSRMHREMEKDPKTLAFSVYFELYTAQRCFAPGCQETYAGAGRKFAYCSGCKRVPYCSKECQTAAWKHPKISHKDVCKSLRFLAEQTHLTPHPEPSDGPAFVQAIQDKELAAKIGLHMQDLRKELSTNVLLKESRSPTQNDIDDELESEATKPKIDDMEVAERVEHEELPLVGL